MKLKRLKKSKRAWRYDFKILACNKEVNEQYNVAVRGRFEGLQEVEDSNVYWEEIREIITVLAATIKTIIIIIMVQSSISTTRVALQH